MGRIAVFLDAGYLDKLLQQQTPPARVDYALLVERLAAGAELLRSYYYFCMPFMSPTPAQLEKQLYQAKQGFVRYLTRLDRFQLRQGKLAYRDGKFEQKRVDILLAVDLVRLSWQHCIESAAILAGDSDFVPAIEAAKDAGVVVKLFYSPAAVHDELLAHCDERVVIDAAFLAAVARK